VALGLPFFRAFAHLPFFFFFTPPFYTWCFAGSLSAHSAAGLSLQVNIERGNQQPLFLFWSFFFCFAPFFQGYGFFFFVHCCCPTFCSPKLFFSPVGGGVFGATSSLLLGPPFSVVSFFEPTPRFSPFRILKSCALVYRFSFPSPDLTCAPWYCCAWIFFFPGAFPQSTYWVCGVPPLATGHVLFLF